MCASAYMRAYMRVCVEGAGVRVCVRVSLPVYVCLCVCLQEGLCDIAF